MKTFLTAYFRSYTLIKSKKRLLTSVAIGLVESRNIYVLNSDIESLEYISHTGQAFIHRIAQPYGDEGYSGQENHL
jgi:hypothetical protein